MKETSIYSVHSSPKSHPLWVTLYMNIVPCTVYMSVIVLISYVHSFLVL